MKEIVLDTETTGLAVKNGHKIMPEIDDETIKILE